MIRAAKIKIKKLTSGSVPAEHITAIVAGALAVMRKRPAFDFKLIEVSHQALSQSSPWIAQGRTMVHESHVTRHQPQPMTPAAHAWPSRRIA